jgi:two-component system response regulator RegA
LLGVRGYRVLTATSAAEGERLFDEHLPAVVISDLHLPGISGLELVRRLRARAPDQRILIYSGICAPEVVSACIRAGAEDFVPKHGDAMALVEHLAGRRPGIGPHSSALFAYLPSADEAHRRHCMAVLESCNGNVSEAARVLKISRSTLQRSLRDWSPDR